FNLPAGQSAVLVVNEVNANQFCSAYSLKVSGLLTNTDGGGECPRLTTSVSTPSLWPPNHNLVNVGLPATAAGDGPGPRTISGDAASVGKSDELGGAPHEESGGEASASLSSPGRAARGSGECGRACRAPA